ncbi:MAG: methionine--tRNA ligase [Clostridia bacterium]|nr:methionine--tRNA ligase [Clostridia bacterium]
MTILIGGAWPYANGSLHIGHIAGLLPGDILARYFRSKGEEVCYVSGSDCHGTPIQIRARKEGVDPASIAGRYHEEFSDCFKKLGFSYDLYTKTDDPAHKNFVHDFFLELRDQGYIYKKSIEQAYCDTCHQFLPDRFVIGICPQCRSHARGDQCDQCGSLLDPILLQDRKCSVCGEAPVFKATEHFFLALSRLEAFIREYVANAEGWRTNAINLSQRYIEEGLKDRAVTRDLDWGIDVPVFGFENKKIYVWVEAVLGYLSASYQWCRENKRDWNELWSDFATHYYIHGKDNIPFHTIILPALLKAYGNVHLPDRIISSEYLTLEGRKISTSGNWAIWIPYLLEHYHPDSIRYFFIANGPEKRDTDFSWREFINSHNGELLGAFGNFVNRSLVFVQKYFDSSIPEGQCSPAIEQSLQGLYPKAGKQIEEGNFKDALEAIFSLVRTANKYFDEEQPWISIKGDLNKCKNTLFTCIQIIANLSSLLEPFIPFSAEKIRHMLNISGPTWKYHSVDAATRLLQVEILFERIDKNVIEEELQRLKST